MIYSRGTKTDKSLSHHVTWAEGVRIPPNSTTTDNHHRENDNDEHYHRNDDDDEEEEEEEVEEYKDEKDSFSSSSSSYASSSTSSSGSYKENQSSFSSSNNSNSSDYEDDSSESSTDSQEIKQRQGRRATNRKRPSLMGLPLFTIRNRKQQQQQQQQLSIHTNATATASSSPDDRKKAKSKTSTNHKNLSSFESIPSIKSLYLKSFQIMISSCTKKSSILLIFSLLFWLFVQYQVSRSTAISSSSSYYHPQGQQPVNRNADLQQKLMKLRKPREQSALKSLGSAAGALFQNTKRRRRQYGTSSGDVHAKEDKLPKGCSPQPWHHENHPTCNDVHSLDLREVLNMQRRGMKIPANLGDGDKSFDPWGREDKVQSMKMGYLGSGLWRQVWRVQPRLRTEDAVLKVMKSEHPVNPRNFDRHRRDALVMDVLKKSDRIVDVYGFCGNTVLTEYAGITLDDFLFEGWHEIAPYKERYDLRREDGLGKVDLALDVLKGLNALHERGILHADLQAKQMLLDPVVGVKVNDFNRCRLLPVNDKTGELCKWKIPSAPGGFRSPEEYELQKVDTKADVFSAANILYGVLTGKQPWGDELMTLDIQKRIIKGIKPEIDEKYLRPGTVDAALSQIVLKAYELNPKDRSSAEQLIKELEQIKTGVIG